MRFFTAFLFVVLLPFLAHAGDHEIGDKVFVKEGATGKSGAKVIEAKITPFPFIVEDIEVGRERLLVQNAWFRSADLMTAEEALKYYSQQIQRNPESSRFWRCRGCVSIERNETGDAIRDFTEAIRLEPQSSEAYFGRGIALCQRSETESGVKDFTEAISLQPDMMLSYKHRAIAWVELNELDKAISDYAAAFRLGLQDAACYCDRSCLWGIKAEQTADLKLKTTFYDNQINDLNAAVREDSQFAPAYLSRGDFWRAKGDFAKAIDDYSANIRIDPAGGCYVRLAEILATCPDDRYRDGKTAVEFAIKSCESTGWKNWWSVDTLAAAYAESGDFSNAIKWAEKSLNLAVEDQKQKTAERLEMYRANKPYRDLPKN